LPMKEESGLEFSSENKFAHTCGHDMHTAMLLGAAKILKEHEGELNGIVKFMFQPDEEGLSGAKAMINAGILENPKVDAAFALHVASRLSPVGMIAYAAGPISASSDIFRIEIKGCGGHGARPNLAIDPINTAAHIVIGLQEINARENNPLDPLVITVGSINSGYTSNIIPEQAVIEGSIRAYSKENRTMSKKRLEEISSSIAKAFRCECSVKYLNGTPSLFNNRELVAELQEYLAEVVPAVVKMPPNMASEDFAYVVNEVPGVYMGIAAGGDDPIYKAGGQHNPNVVFNEEVLAYGTACFCNSAIKWLDKHKE
jgi:amidohydrolase